MSTSAIVAKKVTGGYMAIYNHWDGYPEGVGRDLVYVHNNGEAVEKLMKKGDGSTLTESYRDRGEKGVDAKFVMGEFSDLLEHANNYGADFVYVWSGKNWMGYDINEEEKVEL